MKLHQLESEMLTALPERMETSDYNFSGVAIHQGNLGIQIGGVAMQAMLQANLASVTTTQTNF